MGFGQGGGFAWSRDIAARLPEQIDPGAVFPLQVLDANLVHRHLGTPDAPVFGPHQSYGDPTLEVSARPGVELPPLCCEADGYHFQGSHCLNTQYPTNGGDEGRKMSTFMESYLQVNLLLSLFCLLKTLLWCLSRMYRIWSTHFINI